LGVQWHPEWGAKLNPVSTSLFRRFGAAARGMTPWRMRGSPSTRRKTSSAVRKSR